jgi:hypothetical protein
MFSPLQLSQETLEYLDADPFVLFGLLVIGVWPMDRWVMSA